MSEQANEQDSRGTERTKWERFKCAIGLHGSLVNVGAGCGSVLIEGQQIRTECRIWRCVRCGREFGWVTCPQLLGWWGRRSVSADFVRRTSGYRDFNSAQNKKEQGNIVTQRAEAHRKEQG